MNCTDTNVRKEDYKQPCFLLTGLSQHSIYHVICHIGLTANVCGSNLSILKNK